MVIDTSALIAIMLLEPESDLLQAALEKDPVRLISPAGVLEATIVLEQKLGGQGQRELDLMLRDAGFEIVPIDAAQTDWARHAFLTYGKGRHPAGLNFGDCFSYALSKVAGEPLLFKGQDFSRTDITRVTKPKRRAS